MITDGTHRTPHYVKEGVPFLSVKNVRESGLDFKNVQYISEDEHKELIKRCHPLKGDVLYTKVGTTGIAKSVEIDKEFSIFVSVALLRPDVTKITPEYLEKALNSSACREQAKALTQGVGNQNLVIKDLRKIEFTLPPLSEQHLIAKKIQELMQEVERARTSCKKQLEEAKALPAAYLREVFESDEAKKWERKKLREICISAENRDPRTTPEIPFQYVDISSVDNHLKRITKTCTVLGKDAPSRARQVIKTNDILVATTRPNLNAVALVPKELNNESGVSTSLTLIVCYDYR